MELHLPFENGCLMICVQQLILLHVCVSARVYGNEVSLQCSVELCSYVPCDVLSSLLHFFQHNCFYRSLLMVESQDANSSPLTLVEDIPSYHA